VAFVEDVCGVEQPVDQRGAVALSERVLINGAGAAIPVVELDLEPLRRDPRQRVGDYLPVGEE